MSVYDEITQAIFAELDLFIHPERWPHTGLLPVVRRGGDPIYCSQEEGIPVDYMTSEELLEDWSID